MVTSLTALSLLNARMTGRVGAMNRTQMSKPYVQPPVLRTDNPALEESPNVNESVRRTVTVPKAPRTQTNHQLQLFVMVATHGHHPQSLALICRLLLRNQWL